MSTSDPQPPTGPLTRRERRALEEHQNGDSVAQPEADAVPAEAAPAPLEPEDAQAEPAFTVEVAEELTQDLAAEPSAPVATASTEQLPDAAASDLAPTAQASDVMWSGADANPTALTWLSPSQLGNTPPSHGDLLEGVKRRRGVRASVIVPIVGVIALVTAYATTMIMWPLNSVTPTIEAIEMEMVAAPAAEIEWPSAGSGGVGIAHVSSTESTDTRIRISNITALVTSLMVLDRMPLAVGETGETFRFTQADRDAYQAYRNRGEPALQVPLNRNLNQLQLLRGILIGSANNYADRLAREVWGPNENFRAAAREWLDARGLDNVRIVDPSGISESNRATPADVIRIAEMAMANPVIREIVGTESVSIPGPGTVRNTNRLLGEDGIIGVKTGSLGTRHSLVAAKEVEIGGTRVQLYATALRQTSRNNRDNRVRELFAQLEEYLANQPPTVARGTVVGKVTTVWGEESTAVTDADTRVVLWNGAGARIQIDLDISWELQEITKVGTLSAIGPLDNSETTISLTQPLAGPDIWWRLTHPLDLLGLNSD